MIKNNVIMNTVIYDSPVDKVFHASYSEEVPCPDCILLGAFRLKHVLESITHDVNHGFDGNPVREQFVIKDNIDHGHSFSLMIALACSLLTH